MRPLEEIKAGVDAAEDGPWDVVWKRIKGTVTGYNFGYVLIKTVAVHVVTVNDEELADKGGATPEFIANSRIDVPDMIAEIERLKRGLASVVKLLERECQWRSGYPSVHVDDALVISRQLLKEAP